MVPYKRTQCSFALKMSKAFKSSSQKYERVCHSDNQPFVMSQQPLIAHWYLSQVTDKSPSQEIAPLLRLPCFCCLPNMQKIQQSISFDREPFVLEGGSQQTTKQASLEICTHFGGGVNSSCQANSLRSRIEKQRLKTQYGTSTVEIDTALKRGGRVGGLVTKAPTPPPLPSADACAIDSLHLTSAMSEQQSIQQITARERLGVRSGTV